MTKLEMFNLLFEQYPLVRVIVNADDDDVMLPAGLDGQQNIDFEPGNGHNHQDLVVDEKGISARMSFNRSPHHVFLGWSGVGGFACQSFTLLWNPADRGAPEPKKPTLRAV